MLFTKHILQQMMCTGKCSAVRLSKIMYDQCSTVMLTVNETHKTINCLCLLVLELITVKGYRAVKPNPFVKQRMIDS